MTLAALLDAADNGLKRPFETGCGSAAGDRTGKCEHSQPPLNDSGSIS
jgi:hypothetical protein